MSDAVTRSAGEARAALARAGITQVRLAELTNRSQSYWSRRLSGELAMDVADLAEIAGRTGVRLADLVEGAA